MIPKLVNVKRKTMLAAETMAGTRRGSVTSRAMRRGEAPRVAAASASAGSSASHAVPTVRTTIAML